MFGSASWQFLWQPGTSLATWHHNLGNLYQNIATGHHLCVINTRVTWQLGTILCRAAHRPCEELFATKSRGNQGKRGSRDGIDTEGSWRIEYRRRLWLATTRHSPPIVNMVVCATTTSVLQRRGNDGEYELCSYMREADWAKATVNKTLGTVFARLQ
jgi:hypothetical protein